MDALNTNTGAVKSRAYAEAIDSARNEVATFLGSLDRTKRMVILCHFDADGLAAGALLGRGIPRIGFNNVQIVPAQRGESAFSDALRTRLAHYHPDYLIVTDLGIDRSGVLADVPTLYIDHHRPEGMPQNAVVVSGYEWDPIPCSAWLAYDPLAAVTDMSDLNWIAAIGILSDLGDAAPWAELAAVKKQYTAKWLREAVALVNAARRSSAFDIDTPLNMLLTVDHPRAISQDDASGAKRLRAYRDEVNAELQQARRHPPIFSATHPIALIKLHSACQIHPLIAQQWRGRLRQYAVIAANTGYMPGVVAFSARTARDDINLPVLFQAVDLGDHVDSTFGRGHDQASGGHLPPHAFNHMLAALGFEQRTFVPEHRPTP